MSHIETKLDKSNKSFFVQRITVQGCVKRAKRECFKYQREMCNSYPESVMHNVTWQNDRLEETSVEKIEECKTVDACKIVQEVKEEERVVDKQVCNQTRTEQKEQCTMEYNRNPDEVTISNVRMCLIFLLIRFTSRPSTRLTTSRDVSTCPDRSVRATPAPPKAVLMEDQSAQLMTIPTSRGVLLLWVLPGE